MAWESPKLRRTSVGSKFTADNVLACMNQEAANDHRDPTAIRDV